MPFLLPILLSFQGKHTFSVWEVLVTYLESYRDEYLASPQIYVADGRYGTIFDLKKCRNAIEKWIREDTDISKYLELFSLYPNLSRIQYLLMHATLKRYQAELFLLKQAS